MLGYLKCKTKLVRSVALSQQSHMIMDNLFDVITLSPLLQLSKIIYQWSHTGREVQHTIYQLTQGDLACK